MSKQEQITAIVENILEKLSFNGEVIVTENEYSYQVQITISTDQSLLIGQGGLNLAALQHIIRLICRKTHQEVQDEKEIHVDINNYWKEKERKLTQEVHERAEKVSNTGEEYIFPPMEAHDRKIVHAAAIGFNNVRTESIGSGRNRQVRLFKEAL